MSLRESLLSTALMFPAVAFTAFQLGKMKGRDDVEKSALDHAKRDAVVQALEAFADAMRSRSNGR